MALYMQNNSLLSNDKFINSLLMGSCVSRKDPLDGLSCVNFFQDKIIYNSILINIRKMSESSIMMLFAKREV